MHDPTQRALELIARRTARLEVLLQFTLQRLFRMENRIMATLTDLEANVRANTDVIDSAIVLLQGLKTKLDEAIASGDPAKLQALADELGSADAKLAAAVVANTPAEPAP